MDALLLQPLLQVDPGGCEAMLQCCGAPQEYALLHALGVAHGIPSWVDHMRGMVLRDPARPVPAAAFDVTAPPVAGVGPATIAQAEDMVLEGGPAEAAPLLRQVPGNDGADVRTRRDDENGEPSGKAAVSDADPQVSCRGVVERIRQEEFGFGVELGPDGQRLVGKQNARLGRALHRLSLDLYSRDTHFVLELVQNADDNAYAAAAVPTLSFVIDDGGIVCLNNEEGFTEQNVRALCDVGHSTKAETSGYCHVLDHSLWHGMGSAPGGRHGWATMGFGGGNVGGQF